MARSNFYFSWIFSGFLFVVTTANPRPKDYCEIMSVSVEKSLIPSNRSLLWNGNIDDNLNFRFKDDNGVSENERGLLRISIHFKNEGNGKLNTTTSSVSNNRVKSIKRSIVFTSNNIKSSVKLTEELLLDVKHGVRSKNFFQSSG